MPGDPSVRLPEVPKVPFHLELDKAALSIDSDRWQGILAAGDDRWGVAGLVTVFLV